MLGLFLNWFLKLPRLFFCRIKEMAIFGRMSRSSRSKTVNFADKMVHYPFPISHMTCFFCSYGIAFARDRIVLLWWDCSRLWSCAIRYVAPKAILKRLWSSTAPLAWEEQVHAKGIHKIFSSSFLFLSISLFLYLTATGEKAMQVNDISSILHFTL